MSLYFTFAVDGRRKRLLLEILNVRWRGVYVVILLPAAV